jgi:stearoyl-CoA desaturase (delta-9 desaturase)
LQNLLQELRALAELGEQSMTEESSVAEAEATVLPVADPVAELPPAPEKEIALSVRVAILTAVILPLAALLLAVVSLWGRGFTWIDFGLLASMYVMTVLGITVGFHRLFTHRSFETNPVVAFILGVLGSMAVQGQLFNWVALHRRHHQHSDEENDPHSPHHHGHGIAAVLRGIWHAHVGWLFHPHPPDLDRYVKDLQQSPSLRIVDRLFFLWVALGLLLPAVLGGLLTGTWSGVFWGFMWGGLVRVLLVHHVTWSVNSVCHLWGRRPYQSGDESRNNFLFGFLALGEGWHNTHHAFPTSARHGLRWWQVDVSYWVIRLLEQLRLAWNLKLPSRQMLAMRRTPR